MSSGEATTARALLRSMMIIGSSQGINILISIVRVKVLAVVLGPSGIGLLSIYNMLQGVVQQAAGLGIETSGVREIARARENEATLSRVRHVLFVAHLVQGVLALAALWLLRTPITIWLFGNPARATEVGLIGVAILLALLGSAQTALLQGMRRISHLGRITVLAAFFATVVGLAAVWMQGERGLIWFILIQPLIQILVALNYTRRLPKSTSTRLSLTEIWKIWKPMAWLGAAFMLAKLGTTTTLLLIQGRVSQELGLGAAGHFAASWGISIMYVGFILAAMGADYYPRLTEIIDDRVAAVGLINEQAQLSLAIGGPVLLLLIGMSPWVIPLLYSGGFEPAITLLQWQTLGNVFKLASFAMSYSIVAAARAKAYLLMELSFNIVFFSIVFSLMPQFGLQVIAYAFVLGYLVYLIFVYILARRTHGFRPQRLSIMLLGLHTALAIALLIIALHDPLQGAVTSLIFSSATAVVGLRVVLIKVGSDGRVTSRLARIYTIIHWPLLERQ